MEYLAFIIFLISILLCASFVALGYAFVYLHKERWLGVLFGMIMFLVNFSISSYIAYYTILYLIVGGK